MLYIPVTFFTLHVKEVIIKYMIAGWSDLLMPYIAET